MRARIFTFMFSLVVVVTLLLPGSGYDYLRGIELNDSLIVNYVGSMENSTIFALYEEHEILVSYDEFPRGVVDNLLGMGIGEIKRFRIDASQGYTDPEHPLYGEALVYYFEVLEVIGITTPEPGIPFVPETTEQVTESSTEEAHLVGMFIALPLALSLALLVRRGK
ncbi:MAG: FKBP-type peptidyl-prolyl cis-trans isomerase [Candidatus Kariarchaeaceae archaeon]|jgi:FKBP-type peptidyl-prolyl cis-trans isomerase 2